MVKVEDTKEGTITYYPFLDKREDITRYEPNIIRKFANNRQLVDLNLDVSNLDRESWKKIEDVMKEIFFEQPNLPDPIYSYTWAGGIMPNGGVIFTGGGNTNKSNP